MSRHIFLLTCLLMPASAGAQSITITPWPGGIVPIQFDVSATTEQQTRLFNACAMWSQVAAVKCVSRTTQVPYLQVRRFGGGCVGPLGAPQYGEYAVLNLQAGCYGGYIYNGREVFFDTPDTYYVLLHELGHVFGLIHEHQRPDRDQFITMHPQRIPSGWDVAYATLATNFPQTTPYDYQSVMHYGRRPEFSAPPGVVVGGNVITPSDGEDLAAIYGRPQPLRLELVSDGGNPVHLRWSGGNGLPYHILAGTVPGGWDLALISMGGATELVAVAPVEVTIYVTIATGTGWHDAQFGNTIQVRVQ